MLKTINTFAVPILNNLLGGINLTSINLDELNSHDTILAALTKDMYGNIQFLYRKRWLEV